MLPTLLTILATLLYFVIGIGLMRMVALIPNPNEGMEPANRDVNLSTLLMLFWPIFLIIAAFTDVDLN